MSDQPETMLEYHFRQLARTMVQAAGIVVASLFLAVGVLVSSTQPAAESYLLAGSVFMLAMVHAISNDGYLRTAFNTVLRTDLSELKRPDENTTGGLADD